jgi:hypothetical protein
VNRYEDRVVLITGGAQGLRLRSDSVQTRACKPGQRDLTFAEQAWVDRGCDHIAHGRGGVVWIGHCGDGAVAVVPETQAKTKSIVAARGHIGHGARRALREVRTAITAATVGGDRQAISIGTTPLPDERPQTLQVGTGAWRETLCRASDSGRKSDSDHGFPF